MLILCSWGCCFRNSWKRLAAALRGRRGFSTIAPSLLSEFGPHICFNMFNYSAVAICHLNKLELTEHALKFNM